MKRVIVFLLLLGVPVVSWVMVGKNTKIQDENTMIVNVTHPAKVDKTLAGSGKNATKKTGKNTVKVSAPDKTKNAKSGKGTTKETKKNTVTASAPDKVKKDKISAKSGKDATKKTEKNTVKASASNKKQNAKSGKKATKEPDKKTMTMSALDAVRVAGNLVEVGDYDQATRILTLMPKTGNLPVEIERWYLLGQIERGKGNIDEAIRIFRKILDDQPDLVKIRYELAKCYMAKKQWYRADYHLRLAMAGADIPEPVKRQMMYYRYIARKNKNWNVWFNFGAVPDNNINQVAGGEECITNEWGTFCRPLPEPVSAIGYNLVLGGNYEFKLSEHWRWKSDANIYTNIYNKHDYDDFYLGAGTGPRYVWNRGDIWAAVITDRRWYGWDGYNQSWGGKLDMNYDFTRRFSGGLTLRTTDNHYDNYGHYLNGQTYSANARLSYSIDATKYVLLRGGADREDAHSDIYSNWRYGAGIGFGAELPFGFHVYVEPYFSWAKYDGARWVVLNHTYTRATEDDFIQRYSLSLSNSKFDIWGFVPTVTFSYTRRDSNMPNREYDRFSAEFTMRQKF